MVQQTAHNVFRLFKEYGGWTSPEHPEETVRRHEAILGNSDIQALTLEAANNTLDELDLLLDEEGKESFFRLVREGFLKILKDRGAVGEAVSRIAMEMVRLKQAHPRSSPLMRPSGVEKPAPGAEPLDLKSLRQWVQEERQKILLEARSEQAEQIRTLKRRIAKLSARLKDSEQQLAMAMACDSKGLEISSEGYIMEELTEGSPHFEEKKALLQEIFNLNKDLRRLTDQPVGAC